MRILSNIRFLGNGVSRKIAFEINRPLAKVTLFMVCKNRTEINVTVYTREQLIIFSLLSTIINRLSE